MPNKRKTKRKVKRKKPKRVNIPKFIPLKHPVTGKRLPRKFRMTIFKEFKKLKKELKK